MVSCSCVKHITPPSLRIAFIPVLPPQLRLQRYAQAPHTATRIFYFPRGEKGASHNEPALQYYFLPTTKATEKALSSPVCQDFLFHTAWKRGGGVVKNKIKCYVTKLAGKGRDMYFSSRMASTGRLAGRTIDTRH